MLKVAKENWPISHLVQAIRDAEINANAANNVPAPPTELEISTLKVPELKDLIRRLKQLPGNGSLKLTGKKAELISRIENAIGFNQFLEQDLE